MLDLLGLNYFVKAHGPGELANSRHPAEYLPRQPFGHEILTVNFGDRLATVLGQRVWKRSHKQLHSLLGFTWTPHLTLLSSPCSLPTPAAPHEFDLCWMIMNVIGTAVAASFKQHHNGSKCNASFQERSE